MKKVCTQCGKNKFLKDFYKNALKKDGKQSECKSCHNAMLKRYCIEHKQEIIKYQKEYRAENRKKILKSRQKSTKKHRKAWIPILEKIYGKIACTRCDYSKCFAALEFHHRQDEIKNFGITAILRCKVTAARIKEIKKCDLLCANCHREFHNGY